MEREQTRDKEKEQPLISIIIPVLNESAQIAKLLTRLQLMEGKKEIIVVDGGSRDGSAEISTRYARVVHSGPGRAVQMNKGASTAGGSILWFLHADCLPHPKSIHAIQTAVRVPSITGGAFEYNLDQDGPIYRLTEFFSNRKNHFLKLLYGDMGIFVRREIFERLNGFKEIPLMEDMDFCRRLKREGDIIILPERILTSARRWVREGAVKNIVRNWFLQIMWAAGVSPRELARWYHFENDHNL